MAAPMEVSYKLATSLLPVVVLFFAINPFWAIMAFLLFRPELELFKDSGLLKYFSAVPIVFLFILLVLKKFDFCWKRLKYIYIFMLFSLISLIYSINIPESIMHILKLSSIIAVYITVFNLIETRADAMKILCCFPLSIIFPLAIGIKQFMLGETYSAPAIEVTRVEGLFTLANSFARFLFVTFFASLPLLYYSKIKKIKIWLFILFLFTAGMIFILKVRSVAFTMMAALFLIFCFTPKIRKYFWIIIPVAVAIAIPLSLEMLQHFIEPVTTEVYGGESFFWRLDLWKQLFNNAFLEKPIFGFGAGTSLDVSLLYTTFYNYPHNDYLRILIENGIFAFFFYFVFFFSNMISSFKERKIAENKYYNLCAFIIILSFLVMSSASNVFYAVTYFWYFFAFLAVVHKLNSIESANLLNRGVGEKN